MPTLAWQRMSGTSTSPQKESKCLLTILTLSVPQKNMGSARMEVEVLTNEAGKLFGADEDEDEV